MKIETMDQLTAIDSVIKGDRIRLPETSVNIFLSEDVSLKIPAN
jgi:hypothetical protein